MQWTRLCACDCCGGGQTDSRGGSSRGAPQAARTVFTADDTALAAALATGATSETTEATSLAACSHSTRGPRRAGVITHKYQAACNGPDAACGLWRRSTESPGGERQGAAAAARGAGAAGGMYVAAPTVLRAPPAALATSSTALATSFTAPDIAPVRAFHQSPEKVWGGRWGGRRVWRVSKCLHRAACMPLPNCVCRQPGYLPLAA